MHRRILPLVALSLSACGPSADTPSDTDSDAGTADEQPIAGSCVYANPFSDGEECKEYTGSGWTAETAATDCQSPLLNADPGVFTADAGCTVASELGRCLIDGETPDETILVFPGDDPADCGGVQTGCAFGQGEFQPADLCSDALDPGVTSNVFIPFAEVCADPISSEPAGDGPDGKVCTVEGISAAPRRAAPTSTTPAATRCSPSDRTRPTRPPRTPRPTTPGSMTPPGSRSSAG